MITAINKDNYEELVLNSSGLVLVDFWGSSCIQCLALMPIIEELSDKYAGRIRVFKVNAGENRRLCISLRLVSLPAFIFYRDGVEVRRLGPNVTKADLETAVLEFTK